MGSAAVPLTRHLLRVRDLMDRAYSEQLDVAALARSAHVSRGYFARSFRAAFGESPHQYLLTRRLERAKALLRETDASITDICLRVGFTSLGSFSATFRRVVGTSPSAYRDRAHAQELQRLPSCLVAAMSRPVGSPASRTTASRTTASDATAAGA